MVQLERRPKKRSTFPTAFAYVIKTDFVSLIKILNFVDLLEHWMPIVLRWLIWAGGVQGSQLHEGRTPLVAKRGL